PTHPPLATPPTLHDALPISRAASAAASHRPFAASTVNSSDSVRIVVMLAPQRWLVGCGSRFAAPTPEGNPVRMSRPRCSLGRARSEEHTSELQSRFDLVCRL